MNRAIVKKMVLIPMMLLGCASTDCFSDERKFKITSTATGEKLKTSQKQFDALVECIAKLDLSDLDALGKTIGVTWHRQKGSEVDAVGWVQYDSISSNNNQAFTVFSYGKQFEKNEISTDKLKITAIELSLRFKDENHLSEVNLANKYHAKNNVLPDRGLSLFWIGDVEIFMQYSHTAESYKEAYVSMVTFTWLANPAERTYSYPLRFESSDINVR